MRPSPIRAAFLDRDGVINHDYGYISRPEDFELIEGVPEALLILRKLGFHLIVVTNQSGIGRGYYSEDDYRRVARRMTQLLDHRGIDFAAIIHCPHTPHDGCECRKPKPGMLLDGAERIGAELNASVLFGDKASDIKAGRAAGVARCFVVGTTPDALADSDGHGVDLLACVRHMMSSQDNAL